MPRARPVPTIRLVAVCALLVCAGVVAFLAACPPSSPEAPAHAPSGEDLPAPAPSQKPPAAIRPLAGGLLPPERPQPEERGLLAIIIDDAGYDLPGLQSFLDLPVPLTVAVLPNLPHSTEAARRVIAAGKDLIVHVPMEPDGNEDPGPGAILTSLTAAEVRRRLEADFTSVPGAIGMNNHMGSRATADEAVMRIVLGYLKENGRLFVDSRTTAATAAPRVARELGMPILQRDVFLDDDTRADEIASWLSRSEEEARARGTAVAIGHVQNRAVADILRAAEKTLASRGVRFARLGEVLVKRERNPQP